MIIINQDKKAIVNFEQANGIYIEDYELDKDSKIYRILALTNGGDTIFLGEYNTEERAKEVLREISYRCNGNTRIYEMSEKKEE